MKNTKPRFSSGTQVEATPKGYHSVTPYLSIKDAGRAIDFYKRVFGAQERLRMPGPDGKSVMHAELTIGDSIIMLSEEMPQFGTKSPSTLNGTTVNFAFYVQNADAMFKKAVDAGSTVISPMEDRFYGDRAGIIQDPFGHKWTIATHIEDVPMEELKKRMEAQGAKMGEKK
jgi:PhnB protein